MSKKILLFLGIGIVVVIFLFILLKKKTGAEARIEIVLNLKLPNDNEQDIKLGKTISEIKNMLVEDFLYELFKHSEILWKPSEIYWESLSINNKNIETLDGKLLSDGIKVSSFFNNKIPDTLDIVAEVKHTCSKEDEEKTSETCDPCKSQAPICTKDKGWACQDNKMCAIGEALKSCCPDGKKATCDPITTEITCGECSDKPDCTNKNCGDDGCGHSCGECKDDKKCYNNLCCAPDCNFRKCGDDGCGGTCGECEGKCIDGNCCMPDCTNKNCGDDGCGGSCGTCKDVENCVGGRCCGNSQGVDCSSGAGIAPNTTCGVDGCGHSCGTCDDTYKCDLITDKTYGYCDKK